MRTKLLLKFSAVLLAVSLCVSGICTAQIFKVYADEGGSEDLTFDSSEPDFTEELEVEPDTSEPDTSEPEPETPESEPQHEEESAPQTDPFDYNLICYTPSISFGTVDKDEIVYAKQFNIVNVGSTSFPITWEEVDQYTAFDMGRITPDDNMNPGDTVTFSVSPRENLSPGSYSARYTFFSANDIRRHHTAIVDVTVTVKDNTPFITSVDITPGTVTMPAGKTFRFDAYVSGGNDFDSTVTWSLTGNQSQKTSVDSTGLLTVSPSETATTFAVIATSRQDPSFVDRAIVTISQVDHIVTVKADPAEGGAVAGGGAVRNGENCSLSASPNNNYSFAGWYRGSTLISSEKKCILENVTEDINLVAKFERKTCKIKTSVNDADAGTVSKGGNVAYGGSFTIKASPKGGYRFVGFVENKKTISTAESLELNKITSDRNITAVFERITCNVKVYVNPQDTGKVIGGGSYYKGTNVELKANAYDGYEFSGWSINNQIVSKDTKYVIKEIKSDFNVTANFMKKNAVTHKMVSGITNEGGSIIPSGETYVVEGGSMTYNIVAQNDYRVASVQVDGKNVGAVASYTFNKIRGNHTITATFEKKPVQPQASTQSSAVAGVKKETKQEKTEYNEKTAAEGAVPEQEIIKEEILEEEELLEEDYGEDVLIPDQEPDIQQEEPATVSTSVMSKHNLDEETLRVLINDDAVLPMLREAYEDGTLMITVNNSYAANQQESADDDYKQEPSLLNFEDIIAETLTAEEKMAVLTGTPISFNVDIYENTATIDSDVKKIMQKKIGYKLVSYFDFVILKTSNGTTTTIDKTAAELEVAIPIPEQFRKKGKKFYVIRNHNGVVDVLDNIGNRENCVTFRTDKFSQYAIAYETVNVNRLLLQYAIIALASLILAILCCVNLIKFKRKMRRKH